MFPWQPLVSPKPEGFVSEEESRSIVGNVFITVSLMIFAGIIALLLFWTYAREVSLFISILNAIIFLYSIKMLILVAATRSKLRDFVFKLYMGSTVFVSLLSLALMIVFAVKASRAMASSPPYVSPQVSNYISSNTAPTSTF